MRAVIPVAEQSGVMMAIHPDDPPWGINTRSSVTGEQNLDRFLGLVDSPNNGLTFCTGSLGCTPQNDIYHMLDKYCAMGRVHFVHARNVKWTADGGLKNRPTFRNADHWIWCAFWAFCTATALQVTCARIMAA